jgi:hypothetical protein
MKEEKKVHYLGEEYSRTDYARYLEKEITEAVTLACSAMEDIFDRLDGLSEEISPQEMKQVLRLMQNSKKTVITDGAKNLICCGQKLKMIVNTGKYW